MKLLPEKVKFDLDDMDDVRCNLFAEGKYDEQPEFEQESYENQ